MVTLMSYHKTPTPTRWLHHLRMKI